MISNYEPDERYPWNYPIYISIYSRYLNLILKAYQVRDIKNKISQYLQYKKENFLIYMCVCVCVCVCVHTYIHTYIHIRKFSFLYSKYWCNINLLCKMVCAKSIAYIIYNNFWKKCNWQINFSNLLFCLFVSFWLFWHY